MVNISAAFLALIFGALTIHAYKFPSEKTNDLNYFGGKYWSVFWKDDFNGAEGTLPSRDNWLFDLGTSYPGGAPYWGNNEAQNYTDDPENVSVDGKGNLRITPIRDQDGQWTSARIETTRMDFRPPKDGMMAIESRIHMPDVTGEEAMGYWPAFWALGSPFRGNFTNWPEVGEFDVMENVNGIDSVWGVLHCGVAPNNPCNEKNGIGNKVVCPGSSCQADFHTYRFEWDDSKTPNEFRWYVDGIKYHNVSSDVMDEASWKCMSTHQGYFIILNVAIGGAFPNGIAHPHHTPTEKTKSGSPMLVDYVAVYTSAK